jgi:hypothetical protein
MATSSTQQHETLMINAQSIQVDYKEQAGSTDVVLRTENGKLNIQQIFEAAQNWAKSQTVHPTVLNQDGSVILRFNGVAPDKIRGYLPTLASALRETANGQAQSATASQK